MRDKRSGNQAERKIAVWLRVSKEFRQASLIFCVTPFLFFAYNARAENGLRLESEAEHLNLSNLNFSQSSLGLNFGSALGKNWGLFIHLSKSIGDNFSPDQRILGIEPVLSQPIVLAETVKSVAVFSIEPEVTVNATERIGIHFSAGPAIFQIDTDQHVQFLPGGVTIGNIGGGEQIPETASVMQTASGGVGRAKVTCGLSDRLYAYLSASYLFGRYRRKVDFDRLLNPALEPAFSSAARVSKSFSGSSLAVGIGFSF